MGIEIPEALQWAAKYVVGAGDWPEGDETAMRRMADAYNTAATTLDDLGDDAQLVVNQLLSALDGETGTAIEEFWKTLAGDGGALSALTGLVRDQAGVLDDGANDIEHTKLMIIAQLVIFAIEMAAALAAMSTGVGAPAGAAAGAAARVATQAAIRLTMRQLLQRILTNVVQQAALGVLEEGGLDLGIRLLQAAKGDRELGRDDWTSVWQSSLSGAIGGALSGGLGRDGGLTSNVGEGPGNAVVNRGKQFLTDTATEAASDIGTQLAMAPITGQEVEIGLDTFTSAATGAAQNQLDSGNNGDQNNNDPDNGDNTTNESGDDSGNNSGDNNPDSGDSGNNDGGDNSNEDDNTSPQNQNTAPAGTNTGDNSGTQTQSQPQNQNQSQTQNQSQSQSQNETSSNHPSGHNTGNQTTTTSETETGDTNSTSGDTTSSNGTGDNNAPTNTGDSNSNGTGADNSPGDTGTPSQPTTPPQGETPPPNNSQSPDTDSQPGTTGQPSAPQNQTPPSTHEDPAPPTTSPDSPPPSTPQHQGTPSAPGNSNAPETTGSPTTTGTPAGATTTNEGTPGTTDSPTNTGTPDITTAPTNTGTPSNSGTPSSLNLHTGAPSSLTLHTDNPANTQTPTNQPSPATTSTPATPSAPTTPPSPSSPAQPPSPAPTPPNQQSTAPSSAPTDTTTASATATAPSATLPPPTTHSTDTPRPVSTSTDSISPTAASPAPPRTTPNIPPTPHPANRLTEPRSADRPTGRTPSSTGTNPSQSARPTNPNQHTQTENETEPPHSTTPVAPSPERPADDPQTSSPRSADSHNPNDTAAPDSDPRVQPNTTDSDTPTPDHSDNDPHPADTGTELPPQTPNQQNPPPTPEPPTTHTPSTPRENTTTGTPDNPRPEAPATNTTPASAPLYDFSDPAAHRNRTRLPDWWPRAENTTHPATDTGTARGDRQPSRTSSTASTWTRAPLPDVRAPESTPSQLSNHPEGSEQRPTAPDLPRIRTSPAYAISGNETAPALRPSSAPSPYNSTGAGIPTTNYPHTAEAPTSTGANPPNHQNTPSAPVRRFSTNVDGERFGEQFLGPTRDSLAPNEFRELYQYTVNSWINFVLREPDPSGYLNNLAQAHNTYLTLSTLTGTNYMPTLDHLNWLRSHPGVTTQQRQVIDSILMSPDPVDSIRGIWSQAGTYWAMWKDFGQPPTVDVLGAHCRGLDQALTQPIPERVEVVRGLRSVHFFTIDENGTELGPGGDPHQLVGTRQIEPGYISSSLGATPPPQFNHQFRMELEIPPGTPAVWMGRRSNFPDQRELILQRGMEYEITEVIENPPGERYNGVRYLLRARIVENNS